MIRPKAYNLLDRCIEDGIRCGFERAHKHTNTPDPDWIRQQIHQSIMNEISEWFDFDEIQGVIQ